MIKFEVEDQVAVGIINYLSAQPISSGLTPVVVQLVAQYNEQKEKTNEPAGD